MPRISVTTTKPVSLVVARLAEKEGRTLSFMASVLIEEALKSRGEK